MLKLETAIYVVFWHDILGRVDAASNTLQDPKHDLNTAVAVLKSLECFVREKRECFHVYEKKGQDISGTDEYSPPRIRHRNVRLNRLDYGRSEEVTLSHSEKFRADNFLPVIDQFLRSLNQRLKAYENTCSLFGFLSGLESLSCTEIEAAAVKLVCEYNDDLYQSLKNRLRTTMHHDRLSHLALMSIEYDILRDIDFDILITKFARAKSRKVSGL
ncbi:uncharacterized protein LOC135226935 [Macrobrachium nipponense]|uniref:uncharacterized protein LOC135226935 n=1 Tax=Macrobrachium nipponense TaxID=159736 RepID=UPI0030C8430B